jgi:hypothetical protein
MPLEKPIKIPINVHIDKNITRNCMSGWDMPSPGNVTILLIEKSAVNNMISIAPIKKPITAPNIAQYGLFDILVCDDNL